MDHVAIMNKSWKLIPKILSGEKSIESRWYQTKRIPWDRIKIGDKVFFKDSGSPITAKANVSEVIQFEIRSAEDISAIIRSYGKEIGLSGEDLGDWAIGKRYCVLIRLTEPTKIKPFNINKTGFGTGAAWIAVRDISKIKNPI